MRTAIAVLLVAGLAVLGVPHLGGLASLGAQQGATVSGEGFAPGSEVTLVDVNNNVIATGTADAAGNVTFTNVPIGNFTLVGVDAAGSAVASTAVVTATAIADGVAVVAGVATAVTGGVLGAVGGIAGAIAIAGGIAAATLGVIAAAQPNLVTICHVLGGGLAPNTLEVNQNALAGHLAHGDDPGACVASP